MISSGALVCKSLAICIAALISAANGKPNPIFTPLIIRGREAADPVPFIVSIQKKTEFREWMHFCGGSIISPNYVLTSANCLLPHFSEEGLNGYRVVAGRNSQRSRLGSEHRIVSYTAHPKYKDELKTNLGVVKVFPSFQFNDKTISKINFESSEQISGDIPVKFHGWGCTEFGFLDHLQTTDFITLSHEKCKSDVDENLSQTELCVFNKDNKSVAYDGDYGGPLVNEEQTLQIGIFSYFSDRNLPFPSVFTRVSEFSEWIKYQIKDQSVEQPVTDHFHDYY